jgi:hypothetical protein
MIHAETPGAGPMMPAERVAHPSLAAPPRWAFVLCASWSDPRCTQSGSVRSPSNRRSAKSLRIVVPVIVGPGEDIAAECFRLAPSDREGGWRPAARVRSNESRALVSRRPARHHELAGCPRPRLRVTVQAGCETSGAARVMCC